MIKQWVLALLAELEETGHAGRTAPAPWLANEAEGRAREKKSWQQPTQYREGWRILIGMTGRFLRWSFRKHGGFPSFFPFSCLQSLTSRGKPCTTKHKYTQPEYGHCAHSLSLISSVRVTQWYPLQDLLIVHLVSLCCADGFPSELNRINSHVYMHIFQTTLH